MKPTLPPDYFDSLYAGNSDPWNFETRPYEHEKYAATLQHLPRERYELALELGCSIGVLSRMLAERCNSLLSLDVAESALERARARCRDLANVRFERRTLPDEFPEGQFDLILMSEVGYYFAPSDLRRLGERCVAALKDGGDLVAVHYLPNVPDYPLTGDEVHAVLFELGLEHVSGFRAERYRFDAWRRS
jgi:SAM-dependent methyltransferase